MKSKAQEMADKAVAAMMSAIEIYNKPDFKYREETFAILAINAWELLLKGKWLKENGNRIRSLYVFENRRKANGELYKHPKVKLTSAGNPFTHSLEYLSKKLVENGHLNESARKNLDALREIRDSSVHFYHRNDLLSLQLHEVGSASVKNFVRASQDWFKLDLSKYNFYLMPMAFFGSGDEAQVVGLNPEERNLASYINDLEDTEGPDADYSVKVNIDIQFSRSKSKDAWQVRLSNDPNAMALRLSEGQFKARYPLTYATLTQECRSRYSDFVENQSYHNLRKSLKDNPKYCLTRHLDPDNPRSPKQERYSSAIFTEFDKHYTKKG